MNANGSSIVRFLDGADKKFIIPVYQRAYSWKKANCQLLLQDLFDVYHNKYPSHFFGCIVYVETDMGGCHEYVIIDGQQRITTISLLLLAIRNYILENNIQSRVINPQKIINAFLTDEYAFGDKKLKLKLVQGDDNAYDRLIEQGEPIPNNHITINYLYFYEELAKLNQAELEGLYEAITKLMIVNISLEPSKGDDPQLIFESLNSTGMDLDEADKIRNYVLMRLDSKEQEQVYKNYWEKLEEKINKQHLSKFLRYYIAQKTRSLPDEKKLYFAFKAFRDSKKEITIQEVLKDILRFAGYYHVFQTAKPTTPGYLGHLSRLRNLDFNMVTPLVFDFLDAHHCGKLSHDDLNDAIAIIENYLVRRTICSMSTASLNKLFVSMGNEIETLISVEGIDYLTAFKHLITSKSGKLRFPSDQDLKEKFPIYELYNAKPAMKKYIFERLENHASRERIAVEEQIASGELTIEHIMPQTLTPEWRKYLGTNYESIHIKYKDTIGNLTLTAYNSEYSNLMFTEKRDMPKKGFKYSKLSLNEYVKSCDEWTAETILNRADILSQWALRIWPAPYSSYEPQFTEEWVALDDDYDFTNKTIIKINLLGDETPSDNVTDAYIKTLSALYLLDPVRFISEELPFISSSREGMRSPSELGKATYIETNMNSQRKISALRDIFRVFEIDASELSFLVSPNVSSFDINNESTYSIPTTGQLAYELISYLITHNHLSDEEIGLMLTKEYARTQFKANYPILALSRSANMGNGTKYRYRKEPISRQGKDYFISTEWFESNRVDLVNWFKKHLPHTFTQN